MVGSQDERPRIVADSTRPTPTTGADDVIAALVASTRAALDQARRPLRDVVAVGCSAPGPLDHERGIVHVAPNIHGFENVPLAARLSSGLDGVPVFVDRDTVIAAIGEGTVGAARGVRDFVYVTVSTGVGGAIVADGRIVRGATNTAGEIGHWPVALDGPRCGCGSFGCVEAFAGGRNLAERYGSRDAGDVFRAADANDARARALVGELESAMEALGVGLVNVLNPSLIVVGGGIAEHEPTHVLEPMRRGARERAFAVASKAVRIVPAALGADVGMIGAVVAARQRVAGRDPLAV
ncbi:MAG: ROK family protein [Chloroflexota bacterium]|nr:ROK family protein [Chloroflexota bacterium]MDE3192852.1 ROK family protein [Chloroflexota bacterium]